MISGKYPFDGDTIYALFDNIGKAEYEMPDEADDVLASLIRGILEPDADKRLTLDQISNHIWLKAEIPRDPKEVPVIPYHASSSSPLRSVEGATTANEPQDDTDNGVNIQVGPSTIVTNSEEDLNIRSPLAGHLSNPSFATDTTLVPYLETMFTDLANMCRRSSQVEADMIRRLQRRPTLKDRLLSRISRPSTASAGDSSGSVRERPNSRTSNKSRPQTPFFMRSDAERCKMQ
jgi:serine/threonine protein kinase